jgi:hypothetical protein
LRFRSSAVTVVPEGTLVALTDSPMTIAPAVGAVVGVTVGLADVVEITAPE